VASWAKRPLQWLLFENPGLAESLSHSRSIRRVPKSYKATILQVYTHQGAIMNRTDRYRNAHAELVKMVSEISGHLDASKLQKDAVHVRSLLSAFFGHLRHHLGMEDKALYPELINSKDPNVKSLAQKFQTEMGGIKDVVETYAKKWTTAAIIQANPSVFVQETKSLFDALGKRIEKENNELYAAVDKWAA
jgi:hypothetical protein